MLAPFAVSLVQLVISSVVKGISDRGVRKAGIGCMNKNSFCFAPSFKQYQDC